jgi:hypothetical protein
MTRKHPIAATTGVLVAAVTVAFAATASAHSSGAASDLRATVSRTAPSTEAAPRGTNGGTAKWLTWHLSATTTSTFAGRAPNTQQSTTERLSYAADFRFKPNPSYPAIPGRTAVGGYVVSHDQGTLTVDVHGCLIVCAEGAATECDASGEVAIPLDGTGFLGGVGPWLTRAHQRTLVSAILRIRRNAAHVVTVPVSSHCTDGSPPASAPTSVTSQLLPRGWFAPGAEFYVWLRSHYPGGRASFSGQEKNGSSTSTWQLFATGPGIPC